MEEDNKKCAFVSYMDTLPLDIISNILSRLPVKCLLCLKCVCKSWLTVISSPEFAHSHFHQSLLSKSGRLVVFSGIIDTSTKEEEKEVEGAEICEVNLYSFDLDSPESPAVKLPVPHKFDSAETSIIGSCNGLLCLLLPNSEVILVNPAMMTFYKIRKAPRCHKDAYYGFGYDHLSEDYKLVRILNKGHGSPREMRVYSLNSNSWRLIKEENSLGHEIRSCGVLINSHLLHWVVSHSSWPFGRPAIVCYDLCNEQWGEVPIPDDIVKADISFTFVAELRNLDGCLCLTETYVRKEKLAAVWLMKEYGVKESWMKLDFLHSVATQRLSNLPIAYSKGGQEISVMKRDNPAFVPFCWYNTLDKTLRDTGIQVWPKCLRELLAGVAASKSNSSMKGGVLIKLQSLQTKWLNIVKATA